MTTRIIGLDMSSLMAVNNVFRILKRDFYMGAEQDKISVIYI